MRWPAELPDLGCARLFRYIWRLSHSFGQARRAELFFCIIGIEPSTESGACAHRNSADLIERVHDAGLVWAFEVSRSADCSRVFLSWLTVART